MASLRSYQRDFVQRFNRMGADFPTGRVTGYIRSGAQAKYSQHRYGLAADVSFRPLPIERWPVAELRAAAARAGLVLIDERRRTSSNWTGPHLHFQRYAGSHFRTMVQSGSIGRA